MQCIFIYISVVKMSQKNQNNSQQKQKGREVCVCLIIIHNTKNQLELGTLITRWRRNIQYIHHYNKITTRRGRSNVCHWLSEWLMDVMIECGFFLLLKTPKTKMIDPNGLKMKNDSVRVLFMNVLSLQEWRNKKSVSKDNCSHGIAKCWLCTRVVRSLNRFFWTFRTIVSLYSGQCFVCTGMYVASFVNEN